MTALEALAAFNAAAGIAAYFLDLAKQQGASPEQMAEARTKAVARYDKAAVDVSAQEPPQVS